MTKEIMELTEIELGILAKWAEEKQDVIPAASSYWSLMVARPYIDECVNHYLLVSDTNSVVFAYLDELVDVWENAREKLGYMCLEIMRQKPD